MPDALAALALRDLGNRAPAHHRERFLLQDVGVLALARSGVACLYEQPRFLALALPPRHAHEMPAAGELLAFQRKVEMALGVGLMHIAFGKPVTAVPDQHGAAAILTLRDDALEAVVLDGVVLGVHGQAPLPGDKARAAGDCPALHHAVKLEAEVVMQAPRRVLLDDEAVALASRGRLAARLRRHVKLTLLAISLQTHD